VTGIEKTDVTGEAEAEPTEDVHVQPDTSFISSDDSDSGPNIELLWSFQCPMTKGHDVTSIDWNRTNQVQLLLVLWYFISTG